MARKSWFSTRSSASAAKASISICRASARRNAAAFEIEQRLLVEIADGRAVAAFDVVGQDFELGLGVDGGARAQQQVLVELMRVGLLRVAAAPRCVPRNTPCALPSATPLNSSRVVPRGAA